MHKVQECAAKGRARSATTEAAISGPVPVLGTRINGPSARSRPGPSPASRCGQTTSLPHRVAASLPRRRGHTRRGHEWSTPRRPDERGAVSFEFAIVLVLLMVLVFGIVELSVVYNRQQGLHAAAREGARIASIPQTTTSDVVRRVRSELTGVLSNRDIQDTSVTVTPGGNQPCHNQPRGTHVVVTVSAPDQLSVPLFKNASLTLTGRGEFPCE